MANLNTDDARMIAVLDKAETIAVVGHSDKPHRPSYRIAQYLRDVGYTVYAVNPTIEAVNGEISYPSLADVPVKVDIVNIFRRSEYVSDIVDQAIEIGAGAVWMQFNVIDEDAAARAIAAGLDVAMDRCIKVEHMRLL